MLIFDDVLACEKGEGDWYFAVERVGFDEDVAVGSLVISEGESGQFNFLVLPLPVDQVGLVQQPTLDVYFAQPQIPIDGAHTRIYTVHFFAVEYAAESLVFGVDLGGADVVVEGEFLYLFEWGPCHIGLTDYFKPFHNLYIQSRTIQCLIFLIFMFK